MIAQPAKKEERVSVRPEKNNAITAIQIPHPPLNPALAGRCRIAGPGISVTRNDVGGVGASSGGFGNKRKVGPARQI